MHVLSSFQRTGLTRIPLFLCPLFGPRRNLSNLCQRAIRCQAFSCRAHDFRPPTERRVSAPPASDDSTTPQCASPNGAWPHAGLSIRKAQEPESRRRTSPRLRAPLAWAGSSHLGTPAAERPERHSSDRASPGLASLPMTTGVVNSADHSNTIRTAWRPASSTTDPRALATRVFTPVTFSRSTRTPPC